MRQVTIDDVTYQLAETIATRDGSTVEEVVTQAIRSTIRAGRNPAAIIGLFEDEPGLVDIIVDSAMEARTHPLRSRGG